MSTRVRCPACRGAKKVPKLGGIVGECNTCTGKGTILESEKVSKVVPATITPVSDVISAVADSVPASTVEVDVKVDGKRALYKRKRKDN